MLGFIARISTNMFNAIQNVLNSDSKQQKLDDNQVNLERKYNKLSALEVIKSGV